MKGTKKLYLGKQGTCKVTAVTGTITAKVDYLHGVSEYCITPKSLDGVNLPTSIWLDVKQVKVK